MIIFVVGGMDFVIYVVVFVFLISVIYVGVLVGVVSFFGGVLVM